MLLYGKNSVLERLKANPGSVHKILLEQGASFPDIVKLAKQHNIALESTSSKQLYRLKPVKMLQGLIAKVAPFQYTPFDDLLDLVQKNKISLIFLDRINDPQNLGSIIRTCACFGGFGIVIPEHKACCVTETVIHIASGGENYVPIARVTNISKAIIEARECGCSIVGAEISSDTIALQETRFSFPLGLVLGFEGSGIRYGISKHLDTKVSITMEGAPLSLNVAVAAAIFCHEIKKQREMI